MRQQTIAKVLPPGVQVVTGQTVVNESTNWVNQALGFFCTALLVFAFISCSSARSPSSTRSRSSSDSAPRELALLRIVGANRRGCSVPVLGEAALTGLVSSVIGLGLGVLAALGLGGAAARVGDHAATQIAPVFEPRTAIIRLLVGVGVTVVAALGPARAAVRIPPVAALDDRQFQADGLAPARFIGGTALALVRVILLAIGLATRPSRWCAAWARSPSSSAPPPWPRPSPARCPA